MKTIRATRKNKYKMQVRSRHVSEFISRKSVIMQFCCILQHECPYCGEPGTLRCDNGCLYEIDSRMISRAEMASMVALFFVQTQFIQKTLRGMFDVYTLIVEFLINDDRIFVINIPFDICRQRRADTTEGSFLSQCTPLGPIYGNLNRDTRGVREFFEGRYAGIRLHFENGIAESSIIRQYIFQFDRTLLSSILRRVRHLALSARHEDSTIMYSLDTDHTSPDFSNIKTFIQACKLEIVGQTPILPTRYGFEFEEPVAPGTIGEMPALESFVSTYNGTVNGLRSTFFFWNITEELSRRDISNLPNFKPTINLHRKYEPVELRDTERQNILPILNINPSDIARRINTFADYINPAVGHVFNIHSKLSLYSYNNRPSPKPKRVNDTVLVELPKIITTEVSYTSMFTIFSDTIISSPSTDHVTNEIRHLYILHESYSMMRDLMMHLIEMPDSNKLTLCLEIHIPNTRQQINNGFMIHRSLLSELSLLVARIVFRVHGALTTFEDGSYNKLSGTTATHSRFGDELYRFSPTVDEQAGINTPRHWVEVSCPVYAYSIFSKSNTTINLVPAISELCHPIMHSTDHPKHDICPHA
jgi:hypothetical protein